MTNKRKSIYNLIYSALGQVVTIVVGLALSRLFIINFGSDVNGLISSVNQILVYLALFEAGVGTLALKALYGPVAQGDNVSVSQVLASVNLYYKKVSYLYFGSLLAIAVIYPLIVPIDLTYLSSVLIIFFSGAVNVVVFYYHAKYKLLLQAEGKTYISTNLNTIILLVVNIAKISLILLGFDVVFVIMSTFIVNLIQVFYYHRYVKKNYGYLDLTVEPDHSVLKQRNSSLVHQISGLIFGNTDVLVLTFFCGLEVVSVYSVYKFVVVNINSLINILIGSFNFILGQTFNVDMELYKKRIDIFEIYYSAISFAIMAVTLSLYLPFVTLYTEGITDIAYVDVYLPLLFVLIELLGYMRTPMLLTINFAGHFKQTMYRSLFETVINIVVSLVCVWLLGIYGVLIGTICALLYRTNDIIIYANTKILARRPLKTYAIYGINAILFVAVVWGYHWLDIQIDNYLTFGIVGVILAIVTLVIFILVHSLVFMKSVRYFLSITDLRRKKG